jgi:hypothetical protein
MPRGKKWIDELGRTLRKSSSNRKRRPPKRGGSEAVTVEPDRPNLGEGGAAAALEFDD